MKSLKKVFAILIFVLSIVICASADNADVEVKFRVGDSVISINGTDTQVQTPYVVGDGVTLVPLRVITEAFGANVSWDGSTQTITLDYPNVNIVLQIGNSIADVNQAARQLSSSPQLTNGTTMVPLRFISETFGATVTYDDNTREITVVKSADLNGSTTVVGAVDSAKIGDSYYNWSMENPVNMEMQERSFDGTDTAFRNGNGASIRIVIMPLYDDYDFDRDYINQKDMLRDFTLVKAEKNSDNASKKTMHFQAKNKELFLNVRYFITPKYIIDVIGTFLNSDTDIRDECLRIMDTFDCVYDSADTYDMSNIQNGTRTFKSEDLKVTLKVPQDYYQVSDDDSENSFWFKKFDSNDDISEIRFLVYSKSDAGSAKELAEYDHDYNGGMLNKSLVKIGDVTQNTYKNFEAYEYLCEIKGSTDSDCVTRDVFFEKGDYVYNVSIDIKTPNTGATEIISEILNGIEAGEIDSGKVGLLLRNNVETNGTFTSKTSKWSLQLPNSYYENSIDSTGANYTDNATGTALIFETFSSAKATLSDVKKYLQENEKNAKSDSDVTIIDSTKEVTIGNKKYITFSFKMTDTDDKSTAYCYQFIGVGNGVCNSFSAVIPELVYTDKMLGEIKGIIATLKN